MQRCLSKRVGREGWFLWDCVSAEVHTAVPNTAVPLGNMTRSSELQNLWRDSDENFGSVCRDHLLREESSMFSGGTCTVELMGLQGAEQNQRDNCAGTT